MYNKTSEEDLHAMTNCHDFQKHLKIYIYVLVLTKFAQMTFA